MRTTVEGTEFPEPSFPFVRSLFSWMVINQSPKQGFPSLAKFHKAYVELRGHGGGTACGPLWFLVRVGRAVGCHACFSLILCAEPCHPWFPFRPLDFLTESVEFGETSQVLSDAPFSHATQLFPSHQGPSWNQGFVRFLIFLSVTQVKTIYGLVNLFPKIQP